MRFAHRGRPSVVLRMEVHRTGFEPANHEEEGPEPSVVGRLTTCAGAFRRESPVLRSGEESAPVWAGSRAVRPWPSLAGGARERGPGRVRPRKGQHEAA